MDLYKNLCFYLLEMGVNSGAQNFADPKFFRMIKL